MALETIAPQRIMELVEAVASGCTTLKTASAFMYGASRGQPLGAQVRHTRRASQMARVLGFIDGDDESLRLADPNAVARELWGPDYASALFRQALQRFPWFARYCDFVARGCTHTQSAARVEALSGGGLGLQGEDNTFARWGEYGGVFVRDAERNLVLSTGTTAADPAGRSSVIAGMLGAADDRLAARAWVQDLLGQRAFDNMPPAVIDDLVDALLRHRSAPDDALKDAGNALEDSLKEVAKVRNVPLVTPRGARIDQIGALAVALRTAGVIADKHVNVLGGLEALLDVRTFDGLAAFRNMPSHARSVEDWERWRLTDEIALCVILQTCLTLRSPYYYCVDGKRTY